jgi:hypothetical protein
MKRIVSIMLATGLLAVAYAAPADAARRKKPRKVQRKMEVRYENPMFGAAGAGLCVGCPSFVTGPKEKFVKVKIVDDVSPIGYVDMSYDSDGDGISDTGFTVCGATEGAVEVVPSTEYVIFPSAVPSPFCAGSSIAGTVKLTFSNLP